MTRLLFFASSIVVGLGTVVAMGNHHLDPPSATEDISQANDGAFRDGMYLGKLAAARGTESHVAIGRWVAPKDRESFRAGYQRGYNESLASRVALTNHQGQAK